MSPNTKELKKVRASMMNAIHDLPLLVARDDASQDVSRRSEGR